MKTDVMFIGVGGQGILTAISIIGEAAIRNGTQVIMSEVHGMAQRGGTVEAHVRLGDVNSPLIPDRSAEVLVAFEPSEALRGAGKVSPDGIIVVNMAPIYPFTVSLGQEEYPPVDDIVETLRGAARHVVALDALSIAERTGSTLSVNMVMLGALVGTGALPLSTDILREGITLRLPQKFHAPSLAAFDEGVAAASDLFAVAD